MSGNRGKIGSKEIGSEEIGRRLVKRRLATKCFQQRTGVGGFLWVQNRMLFKAVGGDVRVRERKGRFK